MDSSFSLFDEYATSDYLPISLGYDDSYQTSGFALETFNDCNLNGQPFNESTYDFNVISTYQPCYGVGEAQNGFSSVHGNIDDYLPIQPSELEREVMIASNSSGTDFQSFDYNYNDMSMTMDGFPQHAGAIDPAFFTSTYACKSKTKISKRKQNNSCKADRTFISPTMGQRDDQVSKKTKFALGNSDLVAKSTAKQLRLEKEIREIDESKVDKQTLKRLRNKLSASKSREKRKKMLSSLVGGLMGVERDNEGLILEATRLELILEKCNVLLIDKGVNFAAYACPPADEEFIEFFRNRTANGLPSQSSLAAVARNWKP